MQLVVLHILTDCMGVKLQLGVVAADVQQEATPVKTDTAQLDVDGHDC